MVKFKLDKGLQKALKIIISEMEIDLLQELIGYKGVSVYDIPENSLQDKDYYLNELLKDVEGLFFELIKYQKIDDYPPIRQIYDLYINKPEKSKASKIGVEYGLIFYRNVIIKNKEIQELNYYTTDINGDNIEVFETLEQCFNYIDNGFIKL